MIPKFRAFVDGKMQEVYGIKYRKDGVFVLVGDEIKSIEYNMNDIKLMQRTGLQDQHGKDIYKGDIISVNGLITVVEFITNINYDGGGAIHSGFYFNLKDNCYSFGELDYGKNLTDGIVIGNIYENKELLQQGEK